MVTHMHTHMHLHVQAQKYVLKVVTTGDRLDFYSKHTKIMFYVDSNDSVYGDLDFFPQSTKCPHLTDVQSSQCPH